MIRPGKYTNVDTVGDRLGIFMTSMIQSIGQEVVEEFSPLGIMMFVKGVAEMSSSFNEMVGELASGFITYLKSIPGKLLDLFLPEHEMSYNDILTLGNITGVLVTMVLSPQTIATNMAKLTKFVGKTLVNGVSEFAETMATKASKFTSFFKADKKLLANGLDTAVAAAKAGYKSMDEVATTIVSHLDDWSLDAINEYIDALNGTSEELRVLAKNLYSKAQVTPSNKLDGALQTVFKGMKTAINANMDRLILDLFDNGSLNLSKLSNLSSDVADFTQTRVIIKKALATIEDQTDIEYDIIRISLNKSLTNRTLPNFANKIEAGDHLVEINKLRGMVDEGEFSTNELKRISEQLKGVDKSALSSDVADQMDELLGVITNKTALNLIQSNLDTLFEDGVLNQEKLQAIINDINIKGEDVYSIEDVTDLYNTIVN